MKSYWTRFTKVFVVLLTVFAFSLSLNAQIQNGQINGTILDPNGLAVPNATVTATNQANGNAVSATTSSTGYYTLNQLPVGNYTLKIEAQGFKTQSAKDQVVNAGVVSRIDFKLVLGQRTETVEVTATASAVNTEDAKLATTVGSKQIDNLPLNGRNVYDLIQLSPGSVNVTGTDFENGHNTVVNGLREDFNGFTVNGISNKGLSGGVNNPAIEDTVQEFQQLTLNNSAQYGNSAGTITNLVTKAGGNSYHGSLWEYLRNDKLDANSFFLNQVGAPKPALRFNQFGGTFGGPIIKDKLFFFLSAQGDRFITTAPAQSITQESPQFRALVASVFPRSVANLLYGRFTPSITGTPSLTMAQYVASAASGSGFSGFGDYLCADNYSGSATGAFGLDPRGAGFIPGLFAQMFGYQPADDAGCPLTANSQGVAYNAAGLANRNIPFLFDSAASFKQQAQALGNLFNGNEYSGRIDYNWNDKNRMNAQISLFKSTDTFGPCNAACTRGFSNPTRNLFPYGTFNYTHIFSPRIVNEFRFGYVQNNAFIGAANPGVPQVAFDDGSNGFGSYNGYPQFFKEHIYTYSDMLSITHGSHNMKMGVDFRRNIENSEFNVARPSFSFYDPLFFAIDSPYFQVSGVDPGFTGRNIGNPQLASNFRHWRNLEFGAYFQDDWKITRRLTLQLGIRYDLFTRHNELNNLATTFIKGPGNLVLDNITTHQGYLLSANAPAGSAGCTTPTQIAQVVLQGVCGPGGFKAASNLGAPDHNDFGPRVGFAWDVFGDAKTSLRGGFGLSYEGTLYNPLSNSRWNPPYYSFNLTSNFLSGGSDTIIYGPFGANCPNCTTAPTFTGPATNPGQGTGAQANGNLTGWFAANSDTAFLTGIIFPEGIKDPYVYNYYLSIQHEIIPKVTFEVDYVGTTGHKLFRAEDINRVPGGRLGGAPLSRCVIDNFGRQLCGSGGRINNNYGRLRNWQNVVNSNYNALQSQVKIQNWHGFTMNLAYTFSHSIDNGSTWHSGATTANGAAGGEGFTTDQTQPRLDRGNSIYDIRHRVVDNFTFDLPWYRNAHGWTGTVLGGWSVNSIISYQTGPHWSPFDPRQRRLTGTCTQAGLNAGQCSNTGGDYNLDRGTNDRPNSTTQNHDPSHSDWANGYYTLSQTIFSTPCLGCVGNLGRNNFIGPNIAVVDFGVIKDFKLTERFKLQFRSQFFNILNHTNFLLAAGGGGAHNARNDTSFGKAGTTLNSRNIQFGLKLTF